MIGAAQPRRARARPAHAQSEKRVEPRQIDAVVKDRPARAPDKIMQKMGEVRVVDDVARRNARPSREKPTEADEPGHSVVLAEKTQNLRFVRKKSVVLQPLVDAGVIAGGEIVNAAPVGVGVAPMQRVAIGEKPIGLDAMRRQNLGQRLRAHRLRAMNGQPEEQ